MNSYQLFGIFNIKLRKSYFGSLFFDSETDLTVGEGGFGGINDGRTNRFAIDKEVKGGTHGVNNEDIAFASSIESRDGIEAFIKRTDFHTISVAFEAF